MFKRFIDWLTLADYRSAQDRATVDIVKRFARGNVSTQNGNFLDAGRLQKLSSEGDAAMRRLKKKLHTA